MESAETLKRNYVAAAADTVALVLADDSPLPDTAADIDDLALRLRGHISQLGAGLLSDEPALARARALSSTPVPDGYMPSRVHLVRMAEATQELADAVARHAAAGPSGMRPETRPLRLPSRDTARVLVFTVAMIVLILAASLPRT
ncbi:DUF6415 family natural product biosynthesis protein [Streptomyces sp. NBC_00028]|uniref:DUF6415 family natural product biosynthesis protein n=1 Tax=Streptomyces sp. NBC_00028 TaxID=2975624 RepID=UPI003252A67E